MSNGTVLVTGAAGYIGSHACVELLDAGYAVVGVDSYDNSSRTAIARLEELAGRSLDAMIELDLRDRVGLAAVFAEHDIDAVMHFAGLKAVGESVTDPIRYYDVNVGSTLALADAMRTHGVKKLVFSSSCTVYGNPALEDASLDERSPLSPVNPYGQTKLMIEQILADLCAAEADWRVMSLRYFNPIGAHRSGRIGEDPTGVPNNLLPYIMQVAVGIRDELTVFGGDYATPDGTCIRDYIHVVDLVRGHLKALEELRPGYEAINLGTGVGSSVLDVVRASSRAVGRPIPYSLQDRRPGDAISVYANPDHAVERLDWKAEYDLQRMCDDHWRWQEQNPMGYSS